MIKKNRLPLNLKNKLSDPKGLTTTVLPMILILIMLIVMFIMPLIIHAFMLLRAEWASIQIVGIAKAQKVFLEQDLDEDGIDNYAPDIATLIAYNLINFNGSAINRKKSSEKAEGYKYKMKTNSKRTSFSVTAQPIKAFKDAEHQFKMNDDSEIASCGLVPKKRGKKVKWYSNLDTCLSKTSPKTKREISKKTKKMTKSMGKFYCQLIPEDLRENALSILAEIKDDPSALDTIFARLDENQDGELSAQELNMDGDTLFSKAYSLYLELDPANDTPFDHTMEPKDQLVAIPEEKVFEGEYGADSVLTKADSISKSDIVWNKIFKKVKSVMNSCD